MQLRYKLFLLIFSTVTISLFSSAYFYYNNLFSYFKEVAYETTKHDLEMFETNFENLNRELLEDSKFIVRNRSIQSIIDIISLNENDYNYNKNIFEMDKRELIDLLCSSYLSDKKIEVSLYKKSGELIVKSKLDKNSAKSYMSYYIDDTWYLVDMEKKVLKKGLEKIDRAFLQKSKYSESRDSLLISYVDKIFYDSELIGYIKVQKIVNETTLYPLLKNIQNSFWIITKDLVIGKGEFQDYSFLELSKESEAKFLERDNSFFHFKKYIDDKDFSLYFVAGHDKNVLKENLNGLFSHIILTIVILMVLIIFISTIFIKYYIISAFNELINSISGIKNKSFKPIKIKSNDELSSIAEEVNRLSIELKESLEEQEKVNLLLQNMLNTTPLGIFVKSKKGEYLEVNNTFLSYLHLKESDIIGKDDSALPWESEELRRIKESDEDILSLKKERVQYEAIHKYKDDSRILVKLKVPLKNKKGKVIGILGVYDDVTSQKLTQQELKDKEKYLFYQNRLAQMGEMLSMITHQWRQPLGAITSTANSLKIKVSLDSYKKDFFDSRLSNIISYTKHLSTTIDDFRNFFNKNREKQSVKLESLVNDSLKIIYNFLLDKGIRVVFDYNHNEEILTYANEVRQVVLNILKNAEDILVDKKVENPTIYVKTYKEGDRSILEISDNAGGIDEESLCKIFEPYFSTKTSNGGTGLGLYMSKTIIEEHCEGKLEAYNNSEGAVFKVIL